jgi:DNA-binding FadR family transcriptional regulator
MAGGEAWDGTIRAPTLASVIARRLEDEIVAQGWPVGQVLGSESDLLEHFGVSRAVFREAVRVVENTGAARMRRGPGGGLVVTEPNRSGVVAAMGVWFSYVGVTIDEMLEVRLVLLEGACHLAAGHPDRRPRAVEALGVLDQLAGSSGEDNSVLARAEGMIADLAANPALTLFVETLADLGQSRMRSGRARYVPAVQPDELAAAMGAYRHLVEAVGAGDGDQAATVIRTIVASQRSRMTDSGPRRRDVTRILAAPGSGVIHAGKMAEAVASLLREHIEESGWPVGEVLGSETDLIERFQVSRAILREAVRVLEHYGTVQTKRGPRGGIIVCAPDSAAIVRSARLLLEYEGVTPLNLSETRSVIEVAAARLATERRSPELEIRLREVLERERRSGDAAVSFGGLHHAIADGSGNRVLPLFVDVMGELVPHHLRPERRNPGGQAELSAEVHRTHERLVRAIIDGDADQAANRMRRHMVASADEYA